MLPTCQFTDGVGLAVVLAHVGVHKVDDVRADWSSEHRWHDDIFADGFSFLGVNRDQGTGTGLEHQKTQLLENNVSLAAVQSGWRTSRDCYNA